ncbi:hypothetical protein NDU88_000131 [Pleurodeles waltl]|uniref:Uncharacterized protein n=1 Tax=Pleurodeles waltl TaxID=8319 RepID=A0AAV7V7J5_PLEWA|nr:hypothetical protein NDU88_000131 [Pleurodeles waltl]
MGWAGQDGSLQQPRVRLYPGSGAPGALQAGRGDYEVRITEDFSKEINDRRKAFLSLRPRLWQLDVKCGLFDPTQMWIIKNRTSRELEDLRLFLDTLYPQV